MIYYGTDIQQLKKDKAELVQEAIVITVVMLTGWQPTVHVHLFSGLSCNPFRSIWFPFVPYISNSFNKFVYLILHSTKKLIYNGCLGFVWDVLGRVLEGTRSKPAHWCGHSYCLATSLRDSLLILYACVPKTLGTLKISKYKSGITTKAFTSP